jgi:hypothetical protein
MMENFKPREAHRGQDMPHRGQSHFKKDEVENAAKAIDQGPNFGTPGDPPDLDPDAEHEIDEAYENLDREKGVPRSG